MNILLDQCENWLAKQYRDVLGLAVDKDPVRLRWFSEESLIGVANKSDAYGLAIEDAEIGWILFVLPYVPESIEKQVNQALGVRSRLLRESNYSGTEALEDNEDEYGTWRVGLIWLVEDVCWQDWQQNILEIRRESGAAEEISFDAIRYSSNTFQAALDGYGFPRLLMNTRDLLSKNEKETEKWLSADEHVFEILQSFSQKFDFARARGFARQLEEKAKNFEKKKVERGALKTRNFESLRIKNFRNLDSFEVSADILENRAQAIVLFGPNGTGKSSFAEALSLAAFGVSPRLESYLKDQDISRPSVEKYLRDYVFPQGSLAGAGKVPSYSLNKQAFIDYPGRVVDINQNPGSFEGVILNQEDSIKFSELPKASLAARVTKGYSTLADELLTWLDGEYRKFDEIKKEFCRKHRLNSSITVSETAYNRLAQSLLVRELNRPSPEFLDWLRFIGRLSDSDGQFSESLSARWAAHEENNVTRLADALAKSHLLGGSLQQLAKIVHEALVGFNRHADESFKFRHKIHARIDSIRIQLDIVLVQIDSWGEWLASQKLSSNERDVSSDKIDVDIEMLAMERVELEKSGKLLRARLDFFDQANQLLIDHWRDQSPDVCPLCNTNVAERDGIEAVIATLKEETTTEIHALRIRFSEIQKQQKNLEVQLKATGSVVCPIAVEDQENLKTLLKPFLPVNDEIESSLLDRQKRERLKNDLSRMKTIPEAPQPYAETSLESERLAKTFSLLAEEADRALQDPQAIAEVRKVYEQQLEKVLHSYLPSTLGKVWGEITMTLTAARWLLPVPPTLKLEQRGKSLSIQGGDNNQFIRYLYNAAERHVLGLAWFFTYHFARRRFDEAWMLLDDPAQEMDQPSYRELVRLWETVLRIQHRKNRPFTIIVALHQEERALDAARATNGRLYILGWNKKQDDGRTQSTVKKVVLLAPGFHPLKPEALFSE